MRQLVVKGVRIIWGVQGCPWAASQLAEISQWELGFEGPDTHQKGNFPHLLKREFPWERGIPGDVISDTWGCRDGYFRARRRGSRSLKG